MNNRLSSFLILCCIVSLLYFIYVAFAWGIADIHHRLAMGQLKQWSAKKNQPDKKLEFVAKDWEKLQSNLSTALRYNPNNPNIHESLALALTGRFADKPVGDKLAEPYRRKALAHYRQSIAVRPVWPYAWINLALVKYQLGEIDEEFQQALYKANKLGAWEPDVQRLIIDISLSRWNVLTLEERDFVLNIIAKSLRHTVPRHSYRILKLAEHHSVLALVCLLHQNLNEVNQFCKKRSDKNLKNANKH